MTRIHSISPLLALTLLLFVSSARPDGEPERWVGELALADTALTLEIVVRPGTDPALPEVGVTPDHREGGATRELSIEAWSTADDGVGFRLIGLDRPYRFEGRMDGGRIVGVLHREPPPVPSTDLYLLPLEGEAESWRLGAPIPMTDREGYDNQPYFLPGGEVVLYTSMRDGQTDIYSFDLGSGAVEQVTDTDESEYSPTPLPEGSGFSTVRVEADGRQRLWAFDRDGSRPRLLLESVEPVGYHTWIGPATVALFVLGEPATLQIADLETGEAVVRDQAIGRGLRRAPRGGALTYVRKDSDDAWSLRQIPAGSDRSELLIDALPKSEDFTWTAEGHLLMGTGSKLYVADIEESRWQEVADLSDHGIRDITRLAASPQGTHLVVVGMRPDASPLPQQVALTLARQP